ncbi:uncharacterized protein J3R85_001897 [Psidium guajava]|nr:uncharacterized protein J3R85_001897 [Psidium guajava]
MAIREALTRAEKALKMSKRKDWYKILGVSKTASIAEIRRAYKKLALRWHPDKNVENREEADNKIREIAAAYQDREGWLSYCHSQVLNDEEKRTRYVRGEDIDEMGTGGGGGSGSGIFNPFGGRGTAIHFHLQRWFPGGFGGYQGGGFPGGYEFHL